MWRSLEASQTPTRLLLVDEEAEAAKALRDKGAEPPCVSDHSMYRLRPVGAILPKGADWMVETAERRKAFYQPA